MNTVKEDTEARRAKSIQEFADFLQLIDQQPGDQDTKKIQELAHIYFPDSTIYEGNTLYTRLIPTSDTTKLIYYEYALEDPHQSNIHLGIFNELGEAISVLKTKEVSFDGSITINMVDDNIVEIEYYDFYKVDELFREDAYTDASMPNQQPGWQQVSIKNFREDNAVVEFYYYENYRISQRGHFQQLQRADSVNMKRLFPQTSLRVLAGDELESYDKRELRRFIDEIYATHGYIFPSEDTYRYFKKRQWYQPRYHNVDQHLSDIERINIRKMVKMAKVR